MYASRGIGRKTYDDRRSPKSSHDSQSPPIYSSDRHSSHDSRGRQRGSQSPPLYRTESRDRSPNPRDGQQLDRRRSSRSRSRSRERREPYPRLKSRYSRSPDRYGLQTKSRSSPSSLDFPHSRSHSPSLKSDERRPDSRTPKTTIAEQYSPHTPPIGQRPTSEDISSNKIHNKEIANKMTTSVPPIGLEFEINPNASFMVQKQVEPSVETLKPIVRPTDRPMVEKTPSIESPVDRYTDPKPWTPIGRESDHSSAHSRYCDQKPGLESRDGRPDYREWSEKTPNYAGSVGRNRSPSPHTSHRTPVYDSMDIKRPNVGYTSGRIVDEIYGDRQRPRSPDFSGPRPLSYGSREPEMRNRSPEYPMRTNPIADPYRSRSPEMSQYKRDMDSSAASYGIDKSGQSKSYLTEEQSPRYGLASVQTQRYDSMPVKTQPFYGISKTEGLSPSQPSFGPPKTWNNPMAVNNMAAPIDRTALLMDKQLQEKQLQERLIQEKLNAIFQDINSIDELINLKEAYKQKCASLDQLLQKSILREGEILRNKRRNRDGYKDPAIIENRNLQNDVKKKIEEVNRFTVEIDKRLRAYNKAVLAAKAVADTQSSDKTGNYEAQLLQNSLISTTGEQEDEEEHEDEIELANAKYEYYDPGSHWCRDCDKLIPKIKDFFDHLHTKDHWKCFDSESQPWKRSKKPNDSALSFQSKTKTPIKGAQFLVPIRGFYCPLCHQYLADQNSAEEHLKSGKHNQFYIRFTCLNVDYEHKWNSDKGKALSRHQLNEKKRLKEEEQQENEKKKLKEELRLKEEKEAKKRRNEEENRRKEREKDRESSREKSREDYKTKSDNTSNEKTSSDRFRLKSVTLDLNERPEKNKLFGKDRNEREKHKKEKRKRRLSSSSSSSSERVVKKRATYFGDPYCDPKLKLNSFVPLIQLNSKTARRYHCEELLKLIEETKSNKKSQNISIKMDFNVNNDEEFESKQLKSNIDDILKNIDEEEVVKVENESNKTQTQEQTQKPTQKTSQVEKRENNSEAIVSDSSDAQLVIDESIVEPKTQTIEDKNEAKDDKKSEKSANGESPQNSANNESPIQCNSETVLPNAETDELMDISSPKRGSNQSLVKNDISLASVVNTGGSDDELAISASNDSPIEQSIEKTTELSDVL